MQQSFYNIIYKMFKYVLWEKVIEIPHIERTFKRKLFNFPRFEGIL